MARPKAKDLTERELEVMHTFWELGEGTARDTRDRLAQVGRELAYTTVATLIKILLEKEFLTQTNELRPFKFKPSKSFDNVSNSFVADFVSRVFGGSREQLLISLLGQQKLTKREREFLEQTLMEKKK